MTDDDRMVPTRMPSTEAEPVKRRRLSNPRLYLSMAAAFGTAAVLMALVIAWGSLQNEHGRANRADTRASNTERLLSVAQGQLAVANRRIAESNRVANANSVAGHKAAAEADCRATLANNVSDAQAAAVLAIGDVALAELKPDHAAALQAAADYRKARSQYVGAVVARVVGVPACQRQSS